MLTLYFIGWNIVPYVEAVNILTFPFELENWLQLLFLYFWNFFFEKEFYRTQNLYAGAFDFFIVDVLSSKVLIVRKYEVLNSF